MKKNVLFIIPTLVAGGAERILSFLSQNLNSNIFNVQLLVIGKLEQTVYATGHVPVTYLGKARVLHAVPEIFLFLKKTKPDIVLSSIEHLNLVMGFMAIFIKRTKFIVRPAIIQFDFSKAQSLMLQIGFLKIDKVVCQSQDMADNFINITKIPLHKMIVIGNPITNANQTKITRKITRYKELITIGRLNKIKGHERIIRILAQLEFDFRYIIIGDGPEKENVEELIKNHNLRSKVEIVPFTREINKYLSKSDLFLQGSYSEGFPNTVLESCTVGIPVLAFNVSGGTRDIIQHGTNGYLAESEDEYLRLLNHNRDWDCEIVRKSVISKFDPYKIINEYEQLFLSVG